MLIGLACASSCTSEPDVPDYAAKEKMTFDVGLETRASVITSSNRTQQSFKIFGDLNTSKVYINGEYFEGLRKIFDGAKVEYKSSAWNYGTAQYWLLGQEYSFVAIMPYAIPGASDMTYSDSKVSFAYTLPSNLDNAVDLLAAADRRKYVLNSSGTSTSKVTFTFNHLLSQINIWAALDEDLMYEDDDEYRKSDSDYKDEFIEFHRVDIYGPKTSATFTIAPGTTLKDNQTSESIRTQSLINNDAGSKLIKTISAKKITNNKKFVSFFSDTDALLMLPQTFDDDSEAKMVLTYTVNGNTERERQITLPLKDITWEAGKLYTYKFTVSKAYTGQIKKGSLEIDINDITVEDADDRWIDDTTDELKFEFDAPGSGSK